MPSELRADYHRELDKLDIAIGALASVVPDAVTDATTALLSADPTMRFEVDRWRTMVAALYADVDHTVETVIARQAPVAGDLRFIMACVRLVPHLADTVDLIGGVGGSAVGTPADRLAGRVPPLVVATGAAAADTWRWVAEAWHHRETGVEDSRSLRDRDDALADARSVLAAELASGSISLPEAVELAGVARSFERIGRHAIAAGRVIARLGHPGGSGHPAPGVTSTP